METLSDEVLYYLCEFLNNRGLINFTVAYSRAYQICQLLIITRRDQYFDSILLGIWSLPYLDQNGNRHNIDVAIDRRVEDNSFSILQFKHPKYDNIISDMMLEKIENHEEELRRYVFPDNVKALKELEINLHNRRFVRANRQKSIYGFLDSKGRLEV